MKHSDDVGPAEIFFLGAIWLTACSALILSTGGCRSGTPPTSKPSSKSHKTLGLAGVTVRGLTVESRTALYAGPIDPIHHGPPGWRPSWDAVPDVEQLPAPRELPAAGVREERSSP